MEIIKNEIDEAIQSANSYKEFKEILYFKGYFIKDIGKYYTITSPYYNRNIRLARAFGEDYTFENIKSRIYQGKIYYELRDRKDEKAYTTKTYEGIRIDPVKLKISSLYRLYVHYLYLFGKLPPKIHYEEKTKEYYKEIDKLNKIGEEIQMIAKWNLNSIKETQNLQTKFIEQVTPLKAKRENLWKEYNKADSKSQKDDIQEKIKFLTEDINKINSRLQTCRRIINTAEKGEKEDSLIQKRIENNQLENAENSKEKTKEKIR